MNIYTKTPQIVLGFHGCEEKVALDVLNNREKHLFASTKSYDWLGSGIYFWLNDPVRALEWAKHKKKEKPAVIGAIIDLGFCLNLAERDCIESFKAGYEILSKKYDVNEMQNRLPDDGGFSLLRPLDCAVINLTCSMLESEGMTVDSVMGYFQESQPAFPGAGFREKSHTQICVRNNKKILGYFLPRIENL